MFNKISTCLLSFSENYLTIRDKQTKFILINRNAYCQTIKPNGCLATILKVISYITLLPVIVALSFRFYYRKNYKFSAVFPSKNQKQTVNTEVKAEIAAFKQHMQNLRLKFDKIKANTHIAKELLHNTKFEQNFDYNKSLIELEECLKVKSIEEFNPSKKILARKVVTALKLLLLPNYTPEQLNYAKKTYKLITKFLREITRIKDISRYEKSISSREYLSPSFLFFGLLQDTQENDSYAVDLFFLLKHLRKQIKLHCKQDKIAKLIESDEVLKVISKDEIDKALPYLNVTWMHATTLYSLKSACQFTEKCILPFGELKKRNILVLSGKQDEGIRLGGVNQYSISGVNLRNADKCIALYINQKSTIHTIEDDKVLCQEFLNISYDNVMSVNDSYSEKLRQFQAILRLTTSDPDYFLQVKPKLEQKLLIIYKFLKNNIFAKRPAEIFFNPDCKTGWGFFDFLVMIEELEQLLTKPVNQAKNDPENENLAKQSIIIASTNNYGFPAQLTTKQSESNQYEELYPEKITLEEEITTIFAQNTEALDSLIQNHHLKVKTESLKTLETASLIDQRLAPYFYDVYNVTKLKASLNG